MGNNLEKKQESGTTTTNTTTTTVSGPSQFMGSNYAELEDYLRKEIAAYKPETPEEQEKREKRERRTRFLANIADGLGTFHTAFAYSRGVKPMDLPNLSAKAQERFDKAQAERDKNKDRVINYALTLGKIKDSDRDYNFKVTQAEQQQQNWQKTFDAGRQDRADDVDFRNKKFDDDNQKWQQTFDENQRQFNVQSEETSRHNKANEGLQASSLAEQRRHNQASEGLEQKRLNGSKNGNEYTEFYTGSGMVKVPKSRMNDHNISYVYGKTPQEGRPTGSIDSRGRVSSVTTDQMMQWIGQNANNPDVQLALREIGGVTTGTDNTPPSRR